MYNTSLYFLLTATPDKEALLKMFFEDWADGICNNQIAYSVVNTDGTDVIRADFVNKEDAVALKLIGIPPEFRKYLAILNYPT